MKNNKSKIKTLQELIKITSNYSGRIGIVTGCFDVLHVGHLSLINFAKSKVDLLIIGIDPDKVVRQVKGVTRPIFQDKIRAEVISNLTAVDYVFIIEALNLSKNFNETFRKLYKELKITHIITNMDADNFYLEKSGHADFLGIKFVLQKEKRKSSSSKIIERLGL